MTVYIYIDMDANMGVDYLVDDWEERGFTRAEKPTPQSQQKEEGESGPSTEEIEAERSGA